MNPDDGTPFQPFPSSIDPQTNQMDQTVAALANVNQDLFSLFMRMNQVNTKSTETAPIVRGAWTQQEDELLIAAVKQLGPRKWIDIAKFVPTRSSKQCRERWFHRLSPEIRHDPFEPWEDQVILDSQRELGNRWALIAQKIPGRSASAVKNRWYSGLRHQHPMHAQMDIGPIGEGIGLLMGGDEQQHDL